MALVRWVVVLATAATLALAAMTVAAAQLRPEPEPCRDNIIIQPQVNAMCIAPETPSTIVFGAGIVAASFVVFGYLVYRRHQLEQADR